MYYIIHPIFFFLTSSFSPLSDVWSFGVTIYEMMTLQRPFPIHEYEKSVKKKEMDPIDKIIKGKRDYDKELIEIVHSMLTKVEVC
jgi:serine/threonine protein kinase